MSIKIQIKNIAETQEETQLQFLPAKIDTALEEFAQISKYFDNNTTKMEDGLMTNSIRGFPLKGRASSVPIPWRGMVLRETRKPLTDNASRTLKLSSTFNNFVYWNYDKEPSKNDALEKAADWINLANVIHAPVNMEEMEREAVENNNGNPVKD